MTDKGHVDQALEDQVLQDAKDASDYVGADRRRGWSSELRAVIIMLAIGLVMNGVGLFAVWYTNYLDGLRSDRQVLQIDCNSRQAIEDALNQLYEQNNREYRIDIRCDRTKE